MKCSPARRCLLLTGLHAVNTPGADIVIKNIKLAGCLYHHRALLQVAVFSGLKPAIVMVCPPHLSAPDRADEVQGSFLGC